MNKQRGNGQGTVYRSGDKWVAEVTLGYTDEGKRIKRTKKCLTKREALEQIPILKNNITGIHSTKICDLWVQYTKSNHYQRLSIGRQKNLLTAYNRLKKIWFKDIRDIYFSELSELCEPYKDKFAIMRDIKAVLMRLYSTANNNGANVPNIAVDLYVPEQPKSKQDCFTEQEVKKFWSIYNNPVYKYDKQFSSFAIIMCCTGIMPAELRAVHIENVDYDKNIITGIGIKTEVRKNSNIYFPNKVAPILKELLENDMIYNKANTTFYYEWYKFLESNNIRRLSPYACRHTCCQTLLDKGIQPEQLQKIMRHKSIATTLQYYSHTKDDTVIDILNKI